MVAWVVTAMLVAACARDLQPQEVADRFWRAVVAGQPAKTRRYVTAEARERAGSSEDLLPVAGYALGRIVIDGERAAVATHVTLAGDQPVTLDMDTVLVREDGRWRVDYEATVAEISSRSELARLMQQIGKLGETLEDGVRQSVEDMKQVLPAIQGELERFESDIRQRVPSLREKLEAFSRELERALRQPPPAAPPASPTPPASTNEPGTIAL